jgi:hypothetical protein
MPDHDHHAEFGARNWCEHGIVTLRSLQVTINYGKRYLLFSENATYPWIRWPG